MMDEKLNDNHIEKLAEIALARVQNSPAMDSQLASQEQSLDFLRGIANEANTMAEQIEREMNGA